MNKRNGKPGFTVAGGSFQPGFHNHRLEKERTRAAFENDPRINPGASNEVVRNAGFMGSTTLLHGLDLL